MSRIIIIPTKAALVKERTGIENYTFNLIKGLAKVTTNKTNLSRIFLFFDEEMSSRTFQRLFGAKLTKNLEIKYIKKKRFWTLFWLALQILKLKIRHFQRNELILFSPAHNFPLILPKKRIIVVHGLEYEVVPFTYSFFRRWYLRTATYYSCKMASKIIAVSRTTKEDLIKFYKIPRNKIKVIYHGRHLENQESRIKKQDKKIYITYIGRIEIKKNLLNLIKAWKKLKKEKKEVLRDYKLYIAGPKGYGYEEIKNKLEKIKEKSIIFKDYLSEKEKEKVLSRTIIFVYPSFYEGFGMPIVEAQKCGIPVITSLLGATKEIAGDGALLINPYKQDELKNAIEKLIANSKLRKEIVKKGYGNLKRFKSWEEVARETIKEVLNY